MSKKQDSKTYLKDYQEPNFFIPKTHLDVVLGKGDNETTVTSTLEIESNPNNPSDTLVLDGVNIKLMSVTVDGKGLSKDQYKVDLDTSQEGKSLGKLIIPNSPNKFTLKITGNILPQTNKSNGGLYQAGDVYLTQCEAEDFRRISYYLDRPDVMSEFKVRITGDKATFPYMLSNGNKISEKDNGDGTHTTEWHDPSLKPAYLFALVAGKLNRIDDNFTTMSGKNVDLQIFADEDVDSSEMLFAMDCLKRSIKWDEVRFDREYDLDLYMIVATSQFNMGAMENKGLNIFNTSCVLGSEKTATDDRLQRIDDVIAHEYFHNWTGNRVTCRDWFQLSLKEGLTVFRDGQYNADHTSHTVKRINDVKALRASQFAEDEGPTAHPIRPHFFKTINNFYTMTIYEKGAEVIGMIYSLTGKNNFKKALNLYFDRHDGQAVTTEEFVKAMEDGANINLTKFRNWYDQGGTPTVDVETDYDAKAKTYSIKLKQSVRQVEGYDKPKPFHIPVAIGLLNSKGDNMLTKNASDVFCDGTVMLNFDEAEQTFTFNDIDEKPVLSFLRNFSAPLNVNLEQSNENLLHLMQHDTDGYNRWEACDRLIKSELKRMVVLAQNGDEILMDKTLISILKNVLNDNFIDVSMKRLMLTLSGEATLHGLYETADINAIHNARKAARKQIATSLEADLLTTYNSLIGVDDSEARALKNLCLSYLTAIDGLKYVDLAEKQYSSADNLTDELAGFNAIVHSKNSVACKQTLATFLKKWESNADVLGHWFSSQAYMERDGALAKVKQLISHASYDDMNPNNIRSLIGSFSANYVHFHNKDGSGYKFVADEILRLDSENAAIAAGLSTPFKRIAKFDDERQKLMLTQIKRIQKHKGLSTDVLEIVNQILGSTK